MKKFLLVSLAVSVGYVAYLAVAPHMPARVTWHEVTYGAMAQLVAHLLCKQGVRGSSPLSSTGLAV